MEISQAYNLWADQYDTNLNKTRDLEALALRESFANKQFNHGLEWGCGTGKNTIFLQTICHQLTAVDFSKEMLAKAQQKIQSPQVNFVQADMNQDWSFAKHNYDWMGFSLVLEHIENLDLVFQKAKAVLAPKGYLYLGELHPFKQYGGSKARFETAGGEEVVTCFQHHTSDFVLAAQNNGLQLISLAEYFDDNNRLNLPRILSLVFQAP